MKKRVNGYRISGCRVFGRWGQTGVLAGLALLVAQPAMAVDSYRYLHVTIDTPWSIFLFLLPMVLSPFILMAILYWYFASRKRRDAAVAARRHPVNDTLAEQHSDSQAKTAQIEGDHAAVQQGPIK